ncbi:MAG: hypothetical protein LBG80_16370 [Bacteroidales bacterium]|nr:hypothetical protein [Bacteroidales bacterium]
MKKEYFLYYKKTLDIKHVFAINPPFSPDVIIANDWSGLYSAVLLKTEKKWQAKIYFDAHEYAPDEVASLRWRLLIRPVIIYALKECRKYIDAMSTVCDGIAREYEKFLNFPSGFVSVITNTPAYQEVLQPAALHNDKIQLIHHGGAMKERKLELMIKMMRYLDPLRYELTFMLVPSQKKYYDYLVNTARQFKNIHFIEPVETARIAETLNTYDIGVYILKGHEFNNIHALPNKFFEYIQARLAIAIGPSVEMAKIVNRYHLGICSGNFSPKALAKCIMTLSPNEIMNCKNNADKYARELSAENNLIKIKNIIDDLAG